MKYNFIYVLLMVSSLSFMSCEEKSLPQPKEGQIDFFVKGDLDGQAIQLEAGKGGYYMATRRERNLQNLWLFQGQLSQVNCLGCPNSFAVEFRDVDVRPENGSLDIPDIFSPKSYPFAFASSIGPQLFKVSYQSHSSGGNNPLLQWTFGDGSMSTDANPKKYYEQIAGEKFEVCLTANDGQNCETQICNEVTLDINACKADFTAEIDSNLNYVKFESQVNGTGPFEYNWSFGDGYTSTSGDPGYIYQAPGRYQVQLQIQDVDACSATYSRLVSTDPNLCTHNFSYNIEQVTSPDTMQFGHVRVLWWDANGQLYRSDWSQQDSVSNFEITEVAEYQNNELDQATLRLGLKLNCWLSNGDHEIRLENADAYIGVALP